MESISNDKMERKIVEELGIYHERLARTDMPGSLEYKANFIKREVMYQINNGLACLTLEELYIVIVKLWLGGPVTLSILEKRSFLNDLWLYKPRQMQLIYDTLASWFMTFKIDILEFIPEVRRGLEKHACFGKERCKNVTEATQKNHNVCLHLLVKSDQIDDYEHAVTLAVRMAV